MALLDRGMAKAPEDTAGLIQLHEAIAALLADRGEWRQAYEHARHALDMVAEQGPYPADHAPNPRPGTLSDLPPRIPEQLTEEVARLRREHAEAREQAMRDALTASYNRRYLDQRLVTLVEQQGSRRTGLAVALVDLDWFKQVNDTFGHQIGDRVLQQVVELLQDGLPESAFCARYGGEEFVLVIPGIDAPAAVAVAEAARARVELHQWSTIAIGLRVTISIGLAYEPPNRVEADPEAQLQHADELLYAAKQSGRNAVAYHLDGKTRLAGEAAARRSVVAPSAVAR